MIGWNRRLNAQVAQLIFGRPTPPPSTCADEAPQSTGWHCGNAHLQARATLTLVERNRVADLPTIRAIDDMLFEAGPDFATAIVDRAARDQEVPF